MPALAGKEDWEVTVALSNALGYPMNYKHPSEIMDEIAEMCIRDSYSYFDSAVNAYLIAEGGLDIHGGEVVGFVVSSSCDYFASIAFPDAIEVGLRVGKLGNSSVQYELAIFRVGEEQACAAGRFVHVFVDRSSNRPVSIPEPLRSALERLLAA